MNDRHSLKILQVGPLPPPVGGMATVISDLMIEQGKNHSVKVLNNVKTTPEDRSIFQGVFAQLKLIFSLFSICLKWRPSVVHIHTCSWLSFWRSCIDIIVAKVCFRSVVLHVHGAQFHKFLKSLGYFQSLGAKGAFASVDALVVLGEEWYEVFQPWCREEKLKIVPNGVPVPESTKSVFSGDEKTSIICLANYEKRKGQADLVEALSRLNIDDSAKLKLFGFCSEDNYLKLIHSKAEEFDVVDLVETPGAITGTEKEREMQSADVFCLPSYDEGLPMSMLEAMAAGKPVVVTGVGSIPEVIENYKTGILITPGDIESLSAGLAFLFENKEKARQMGQAGRSLVIEKYSVSRVADDLEKIYLSIC